MFRLDYRLQGNTRNNEVDVLVLGENSKSIMKLKLDEFIKEFDKFYNDEQDSILVKGEDYYPYGDAIEFQRDYRSPGNISAFIYCGLFSGAIKEISMKDLKSFIDKYR